MIVIAHSYGGMVGSSVIKGLTKPKDAPENDESGYVIGLILIASGFNLTGMAFMDPFFGHPPPGWRVNNETKFAEIVTPPRELFYHDLPEGEANYWVSQLENQSLKSLFEGGEHAYAGWQDVPSWYIGTVEDRGLPVFAQRMSVSMARSMGASVEHRELQTSHSPFLSQPEATAKIILEAVAAFTGSTRGPKESTSNAEQSTDKRIMFPGVRFMSPLSWFKFGIPVIFGRLLARGMILFGWGKRVTRTGLH